VRLRWRTDGAYENFVIRRAREHDAFVELGTVYEQSESGGWEFWDRDVPPGVTYRYSIAGRSETGADDFAGPVTISIPPVQRFSIRALASPVRQRVELQLEIPRSGLHEVQIFDVTGRIVRTLALGGLPAGRHVSTWDGRDARGRDVAHGIYILRLEDATTRAVLLR
jgi:hypothetical protein